MKMTSLSALIEAAKAVEYDIEVPEKKKKANSSLKTSKKEIVEGKNPGASNRATHNILEKNRRAELKNFFQKLKEAVPKLQDRPKASNVSILTEAMKYIKELNDIDKHNTNEVTRLRRCRMCLEERIKMLKEEINRQSLQKQLFAQVEVEKKVSANPAPVKEMVSIEIQANEQDIRDALPESYADGVNLYFNNVAQNLNEGEVKNRKNRPERLKLSSITNDNIFKNEPSPCSPLNRPIEDVSISTENLEQITSIMSPGGSMSTLKRTLIRKKAKTCGTSLEYESDSETELKIDEDIC